MLQARYTHGPGIDEPIAVTKAGSTFFYHQDGLGTVTELTDSTGAVAKSYAYDAYGNLVDQTGTVDQPYTYTGGELDSETGLYYYRARAYDPIIARFFQVDPLGFDSGDVNLYTYVKNNPSNFIDPFGELKRSPHRPIRPPLTRILYGNYCGPGSRGGVPINDLDAACKDHDDCYGKLGLQGFDAFKDNSSEQSCSLKDECDRDLCERAKKFGPKTSSGAVARKLVITIFCKG